MSGLRLVTPLSAPFDLVVRPPGSKSQTIRALFVAALAVGESRLEGALESDDTRFAREALRALGADIDAGADPWAVRGAEGRFGLPQGGLDAGASGLTWRTLIAVAPLVTGSTTIVGRDRLPERPMSGLVDALADLGVDASATDGHLPVTVRGMGALPGGSVQVASGATTQFATALLLVAPAASGELTIIPTGLHGSQGYLDITIETMRGFGAQVDLNDGEYRVAPSGYTGSAVVIEPDASAAVYPMVAAAITGSRVEIEGLGTRSLQPDQGIARVLQSMGCEVEQTLDTTTVDARGRTLASIDVDLSGSPDGALGVAVAALFADGPSRLRGIGSLRFKESDRLGALANEITRVGAGAEIAGSDLVVTPAALRPARVETYGDHRVAMSFALVGLRVPGIEIADPEVVAKTWPGYWDMLESLSLPGA